MTHPMTCEQFEGILPQLLDDESAATASTPIVRAHLDSCAQCRALYDDLIAIRSEARALPALVPERDLWSEIATRIEAPVVPLVDGVRAHPTRRQMSWRFAGMAAAALIAVTTTITYQVARRTQAPLAVASAPPASNPTIPTVATPVNPVAPNTPSSGSATIDPPTAMPVVGRVAPARPAIILAANQPDQPRRREPAQAVYDREIARLRAIVDSGRTKLDPATVAILDRNLRIIDIAIEQCRQALVRDSASTFLIESMNNAYQTKVKLLRVAAAAASRG